MPKVWVIESGDYEQRSIDAVCASVESGVAYIKSKYPTVTHWGDVTGPDKYGCFQLIGKRKRNGWNDTDEFDFSPHEIV